MAAIRAIHARGRLPILVGGTGFYYRALARGLFPGPGRDEACAGGSTPSRRAAARPGCTGCSARIDPAVGRAHPAARLKRHRAGAGGLLPHRPPADRALRRHARAARRAGRSSRSACGRRWDEIAARIARRVDEQFARGMVDEVRALLARGVPDTARPFGGLRLPAACSRSCAACATRRRRAR